MNIVCCHPFEVRKFTPSELDMLRGGRWRDFSVHNDQIVVTFVMADNAMPPIDVATTALYSTIQTGVPVRPCSVRLGPPCLRHIQRNTTLYCLSTLLLLLPQLQGRSTAALQHLPTAAATAPAATTAATAGTAGAAGTATTAPTAGSQAGLFTGAPTLNIQGTPFQGAYIPNPSWHFIAPNLPPHAQMAPPAVLSEREQLVLQQEEALKRERQQLEVWKLEVECKTLALQSQVLLRLRPLQYKLVLEPKRLT